MKSSLGQLLDCAPLARPIEEQIKAMKESILKTVKRLKKLESAPTHSRDIDAIAKQEKYLREKLATNAKLHHQLQNPHFNRQSVSRTKTVKTLHKNLNPAVSQDARQALQARFNAGRTPTTVNHKESPVSGFKPYLPIGIFDRFSAPIGPFKNESQFRSWLVKNSATRFEIVQGETVIKFLPSELAAIQWLQYNRDRVAKR